MEIHYDRVDGRYNHRLDIAIAIISIEDSIIQPR